MRHYNEKEHDRVQTRKEKRWKKNKENERIKTHRERRNVMMCVIRFNQSDGMGTLEYLPCSQCVITHGCAQMQLKFTRALKDEQPLQSSRHDISFTASITVQIRSPLSSPPIQLRKTPDRAGTLALGLCGPKPIMAHHQGDHQETLCKS